MSIQELYSLFNQTSKICTDTRKEVKDALFFCLKGEHFNGNQFAEDAINKGANVAIIDEKAYEIQGKTILVDDVLTTLQKLARHHRKQMDIPVIGLTGSNGKTTTKELIAAVLQTKYNTLSTQGNLNNHIGVPLTLLSIKPDHDIAVIEMGTNHPGEINQLCQMADPNFGLITNIGKAHLEGFESVEGIVKEKSELFRYVRETLGKAFVNHDNQLLVNLSENIQRITYGSHGSVNCLGRPEKTDPFLTINWYYNQEKIEIPTRLYGDYNFENVMAALCVGSYFKIGPEHMAHAIGQYVPSNNRSQVIKTHHNTLLMDAYNANPTSMLCGIQSFGKSKARRKMVILGDMLELGKYSSQEHRLICRKLDAFNFEKVMLIGHQFGSANINRNFTSFHDVHQAYAWLKNHPIKQYTIYIKGSRGIQLEKLVELL